jgi:hypothetical protein
MVMQCDSARVRGMEAGAQPTVPATVIEPSIARCEHCTPHHGGGSRLEPLVALSAHRASRLNPATKAVLDGLSAARGDFGLRWRMV